MIFVVGFHQIVVGGGIIEKKLLRSGPTDSYADEDIESRGHFT